ncbi:MAG: ribosomal RNA small subunit methyltransferase A [Anaerolineales bacterium]|nr:ribosomal RNA small subunit methyltransferase A [Anaerolineales bacterium]
MKPAPLDAPGLLQRYGLRPDKSLGQNFLLDEAALQKIVAAAKIQPGDAVLEIGPGLGGLTRWLALQARRVVAVELDAGLIPALEETLAPYSNVEVIQGDILALDLETLMGACAADIPLPYLVVANIPYYITSTLIRRLLEASYPPRRLVLTVQREVAERIVATTGKMSLLALSVQVYGSPMMIARIPPGAFLPPPKVDSAVVCIETYPQPRVPRPDLPLLFRLAKAGFGQKRKTLRNALSGGMRWTPQQAQQALTQAGIDPMRRAETLSLQEWAALAQAANRSSPQHEQQASQ